MAEVILSLPGERHGYIVIHSRSRKWRIPARSKFTDAILSSIKTLIVLAGAYRIIPVAWADWLIRVLNLRGR